MMARRCRPNCVSGCRVSANGSRWRSSSLLEKTRQANVPAPARQRSIDLARLKGIGEVGASRLALELFWRDFSNRRQVGACVGLVPQPWRTAAKAHTDQGISKQGNRRVRALLVEMAWTWLRYQPGSCPDAVVQPTHAGHRAEPPGAADRDRRGGTAPRDRAVALPEGWGDTRRRTTQVSLSQTRNHARRKTDGIVRLNEHARPQPGLRTQPIFADGACSRKQIPA